MLAKTIAAALGGHSVGSGWMARCPVHDDSTPSLSVQFGHNGRVLVHCHAGCDQRDVIAALRKRDLWGGSAHGPVRRTQPGERTEAEPGQGQAKRCNAGLAIWQATIPAAGTAVEAYLLARGLTLPAAASLRFHRGLKHPSGKIWPCMVALVTGALDEAPLAIHRTFLARDGTAKAPVDPAKMMLGPCRGGAVRLGAAGATLMVGEGVETCVTAMQATGYPAWAALSTSGLRALDLPPTIRDVIVLADGDKPGEAAAQVCSRRWSQEGRRVRIARPPEGLDFNDVLLGRAGLTDAAP